MNSEEIFFLKQAKREATTICSSEVIGEDRTLLWGYTCSRDSWHVYWKNGKIHKYLYNGGFGCIPFSEIEYDVFEDFVLAHSLIPDKRLYPEACDFDFCKLLIIKGCDLPFTNWNDKREESVFCGEIK